MQNLEAELTEMMAEVEWDYLIPHAKRDAIVIVDHTLDLVQVGVAIATDHVPAVQHWIQEAMLIKPSANQLANWSRDRSKRFNAVIVQPYVLVQEP